MQGSAPHAAVPDTAQPRAPASSATAPAATETPPVTNTRRSGTGATPASAPPTAPGADFGLAQQRAREAAKAAESADLVAHVASVSEKLSGELLLKLDNGQSWTQAVRKSDVFIKPGERVTISRGSFGGYLLRSDSGATMRVRRLE